MKLRQRPVMVALVLALGGALLGEVHATALPMALPLVRAEARARGVVPASPLRVRPAPIIKRVDVAEPEVAITFDACATKNKGYSFDRAVYDVLRREHVPATIFVAGRWVEMHPDVMHELSSDPLIEFANHSYDHPHLTKLGAVRIGSEIDQTEAALAVYGKHSVAFRPPFGDFSGRVLEVVRGRQLPAVLWDVVSGDPSRAVSTEAMIRTVVSRTRAGSIVIFHINGRGARTAEALPVILPELRRRGFRFVHLSTLLAESPQATAEAHPPVAPACPAPAGGVCP